MSDDPISPCCLSTNAAPHSCGSRDVWVPLGGGESFGITPGPAAWAPATLVSMAIVALQD